MAHWLEEIARSMYDFKLTTNRVEPILRTDELAIGYVANRRAHFRVLMTQYGSIVVFETLLTAVLLSLGAFLVIENQINIGQFVAAEIIVILVIASVEKLILSMESVYDVLTALEKMGTVMDLPLEREGGGVMLLDPGKKGISVEAANLTFRYGLGQQPAIEAVSFHIGVGEKVCLAGVEDSGKTTLLHILSSLYTEVEGGLLYNGLPAGFLKLSQLRSRMGHLLADENIQEGTIMENITMGNSGIRPEVVYPLAEAIGLAKAIRDHPLGYLTPLVSEGRNISRSMKSKIILMRSLIFDCSLWLAEWDLLAFTHRESQKVLDFVFTYLEGKTAILSTNDVHVARRCDRIFLLKGGRLYRVGTPAELEEDSYFREIYQF